MLDRGAPDQAAPGAAGLPAQRGASYEAYGPLLPLEEVRRRLEMEGGPEWLEKELKILEYIEYCEKPLEERRRAEERCMGRAPYYELNQTVPFSDFLVSFKAAIDPELEYLDNQAIHTLLYFATGPEARRLLGAANAPQRHSGLNAQEYYNLVQEVLEPAAEREGIRPSLAQTATHQPEEVVLPNLRSKIQPKLQHEVEEEEVVELPPPRDHVPGGLYIRTAVNASMRLLLEVRKLQLQLVTAVQNLEQRYASLQQGQEEILQGQEEIKTSILQVTTTLDGVVKDSQKNAETLEQLKGMQDKL